MAAIIAVPFTSGRDRSRFQSRRTPSAMSIAPPVTSSSLSPSRGMSQSAAAATPTIEPSVFHAYTAPIARSPWPAPSSIRVISGSVTPAQKVGGNMTASEMP